LSFASMGPSFLRADFHRTITRALRRIVPHLLAPPLGGKREGQRVSRGVIVD
jgi:hypothetical protein